MLLGWTLPFVLLLGWALPFILLLVVVDAFYLAVWVNTDISTA